MAFAETPLQWLQTSLPTSLQPPFVLPLLIFFSTVLVFLCLDKSKSKSQSVLPPSPPKLPIIGHLHHLGSLPHRSLHALSRKYGPLIFLNLGSIPTLVVSSAGMAKEIMKTHDLAYANRSTTRAIEAFGQGGRDLLFSPYGEYWRHVRKICAVHLLSAKRVQSYKFIRDEEISNMIAKLIGASAESRPVNISQLLNTTMDSLLSRIAVGKKLEEQSGSKNELPQLIHELMELCGGFSMQDLFPPFGRVLDVITGFDTRMNKTIKKLHEFMDKVMEEHIGRKRDDGDNSSKDFVDILLDCQKDASLGIQLSIDDIKSIIVDMFVAGNETTYTTLEWAMGELFVNPRVMKKIQEEVRLVVGKKPMVDENDIRQMKYFHCVIKETLRLHSVFPFLRKSSAPITIGDYCIPANTRAIINTWAIARDPEIWDRPEEFAPERFIDYSPDFKGTDSRYIPFGAGRRACPGVTMGIASFESILANLLCWFDWELPVGGNPVDINSDKFVFDINLKHPLCLTPKVHVF